MMIATDELRMLLDERGIEHFDHENSEPLRKIEKAGEDPATSWQIDGVSYCAVPDRHGTFDVWIDHVTPEQAIAATVGDSKKSDPRNYKPNGEPKIPNMPVGASSDWVDWVASLEHREPSDLTEAVKQLMFEVICFGGDMGPNGNVCEGIDEGMVLTNDFIDKWAKRIAATVGESRSCASCPEIDNPDSFIAHLMQCERGTCHGKFSDSSDLSSGRVPLYYCENRNKSIFVERDAETCPLCGARIEVEE